MSIEKRLIVGPEDRERTAVVLIAIPAGGEVEIDRTWRFVGWRDEVKLKAKRQPPRIDVISPEGDD
jgi:hypothetical protein